MHRRRLQLGERSHPFSLRLLLQALQVTVTTSGLTCVACANTTTCTCTVTYGYLLTAWSRRVVSGTMGADWTWSKQLPAHQRVSTAC